MSSHVFSHAETYRFYAKIGDIDFCMANFGINKSVYKGLNTSVNRVSFM